MSGRNAWCVAAASSEGWARKVFPADEPEAAVENFGMQSTRQLELTAKTPFGMGKTSRKL